MLSTLIADVDSYPNRNGYTDIFTEMLINH